MQYNLMVSKIDDLMDINISFYYCYIFCH